MATIITDEVPISAAFAFQKESEFLHLFNHFLKKMLEAGIIFKMNKDFSKRKIINYEVEPAVTLGYENLAFPFLVLLGGLTVAAILSCCEKLRSYFGTVRRTDHAAPSQIKVTETAKYHVPRSKRSRSHP